LRKFIFSFYSLSKIWKLLEKNLKNSQIAGSISKSTGSLLESSDGRRSCNFTFTGSTILYSGIQLNLNEHVNIWHVSKFVETLKMMNDVIIKEFNNSQRRMENTSIIFFPMCHWRWPTKFTHRLKFLIVHSSEYRSEMMFL
jgi:hypothetical protein